MEKAIGGPPDREQWKAYMRDQFRDVDDEPRRLWRALRDALADAIDYLDAHHDAPCTNPHAHAMDRVVSFRCVHAIGAAVDRGDPAKENQHRGSIRGTVSYWRRARVHGGPEDWSMRTRLVVGSRWQHGAWWWHGRAPKLRDLAILSLLAGNVPEGAQRQQRSGARKPTVLDVVRAEEKAISAIHSRRPAVPPLR